MQIPVSFCRPIAKGGISTLQLRKKRPFHAKTKRALLRSTSAHPKSWARIVLLGPRV